MGKDIIYAIKMPTVRKTKNVIRENHGKKKKTDKMIKRKKRYFENDFSVKKEKERKIK